MAREIERKFLTVGDPLPEATKSMRLIQGYLARENDVAVRVRITDDAHALIGIKRWLSHTERAEFEFSIPVAEGKQMIREISGSRVIEKTRHHVPAGNGLTWEIDVFHGSNEGLVVAEIELPSEDTPFKKPTWLGEQVTSDRRYLNNHLAVHPWPTWKDTSPV